MEEEKYQKELFDFKPPKRAFPRFGRISIRSDFAITLNLEKLVFVLIGVIMVMVVVYALGVERGKAHSVPALTPQSVKERANILPAQKPAAAIAGSVVAVPAPVEPKAPPAEKKVTAVPVLKNGTVQDAGKSYTILAVTLRKNDTAIAEMTRLKKEGFDAFVRESPPYFQVCVGAYPNRDSAERASGKVRRLYKDAYTILK